MLDISTYAMLQLVHSHGLVNYLFLSVVHVHTEALIVNAVFNVVKSMFGEQEGAYDWSDLLGHSPTKSENSWLDNKYERQDADIWKDLKTIFRFFVMLVIGFVCLY